MSEWLFWGSLAFMAYIFVGFPIIVWVRSLIFPRSYQCRDIEPSVSIIVAAHNEAPGIAEKLENTLALDYPSERLEIIIASDGSDDETDAIVSAYRHRGVRLLPLPRAGKINALNAAATIARNQILVFSDANSVLTPNSLRALVSPFADPNIGGVCGDQRYNNPKKERRGSTGERLYWHYDRFLKMAESLSGNVIAATGAIYAIRRHLFRSVPPSVMDDFVISTGVIAQGFRLVFEPCAIAYEDTTPSEAAEFPRKIRVAIGGLRGVLFRRELLNPIHHGFYALQLLSHKVLRRLLFVPIIVLGISSILSWQGGLIYQLSVGAQGIFYACALGGVVLRKTSVGQYKLFVLPFYFVIVNIALAIAAYKFFTGRRQSDMWEPTHNFGNITGED